MVWKLADAKNKFSKVVDMALGEGPQKIVRRNNAVMVIALKDFERLSGKNKDFKEFLLTIPSLEGVDLTRDKSPMRDVDL